VAYFETLKHGLQLISLVGWMSLFGSNHEPQSLTTINPTLKNIYTAIKC